MAEDPSPTPLLDEVVDQILRGERIFVFPPGIAAYVGAVMGLLIGASLAGAIVLPPLLGSTVEHRALLPLIGIVAALVSLVIPAFLVAQGHPVGRRFLRLVIAAWLGLSASALLAALAGALPASAPALMLPSLILGASLLVTRTGAYAAFASFKQRLRVRRREMLGQAMRRP